MSQQPSSSRMVGLGFEFAAAVAGLTLVGYWLGGYFGNAALGIVIGAAVGLVGGMYNLLRATLATSGRSGEREGDSDSSAKG